MGFGFHILAKLRKNRNYKLFVTLLCLSSGRDQFSVTKITKININDITVYKYISVYLYVSVLSSNISWYSTCITHRIQLDTFKSLWNSISSIIAVHKKIDELKGFLPNYDDLRGAVTALLRLQDTYQLDTNQLAQGRIRSMMAKQMSGTLRLNSLWPPIVKLLYLLHFTSMDILKCNRPHLMIKNS